ncbi:MAG: bifunctional phosphoribosyl-AMP cyclohydrolase/phosphoribosyl-ATP diphosphatase HisIE [Alphaproteobacteria bacterium]|nr:bifunctional phosphoribosyl-AMP cyclohydrolase/phosphoribosyl-ATP diphosphatase HisIE [Alphaproteobacteria bacterium]
MIIETEKNFDLNALDWTKGDGLIPAIVQDAQSLRVLMLGYINKESLRATLETGLVTFYSRSKKRLWQKGETSGHVLRLKDIRSDCDGDAILLRVDPEGPTCHTGSTSCFGNDKTASLATLTDLTATIRQRQRAPTSDSYTAELFAAGLSRIAQKVGEEGVEVALAGETKSPNLADESADLLYHLLVLLEASDFSLHQVLAVLQKRAK